MKVLLLKDVSKLGKAGEIKEVKDGYGMNFLIAKGLAEPATNATINKYKAKQKQLAEMEALDIAKAKQMQESLQNIVLKIPKKTGANKNLFGSLTKDEIASALESSHRLSIDKKSLEIPQIKTLGMFDVVVKLGHGINAELKIEVVSE